MYATPLTHAHVYTHSPNPTPPFFISFLINHPSTAIVTVPERVSNWNVHSNLKRFLAIKIEDLKTPGTSIKQVKFSDTTVWMQTGTA